MVDEAAHVAHVHGVHVGGEHLARAQVLLDGQDVVVGALRLVQDLGTLLGVLVGEHLARVLTHERVLAYVLQGPQAKALLRGPEHFQLHRHPSLHYPVVTLPTALTRGVALVDGLLVVAVGVYLGLGQLVVFIIGRSVPRQTGAVPLTRLHAVTRAPLDLLSELISRGLGTGDVTQHVLKE